MTKYLYIHRGYEKVKRDNENEPTLALNSTKIKEKRV